MSVMSPSFVPSQSHRGTGHALSGCRWSNPLLRPLHGKLLDGCVQALVATGVPSPARAHQKAAVAIQVVVRAPPARRPAAVASARLMPGVSTLAALSGLVPPGGARLVARVVASALLPSAPVASSPLASVLSASSRAVVLPFGWGLQGMGLGKEALHRVDQVADTRRALAALLSAPTSGALVLQRVEAIGMKGHLLVKLLYQVWGNAMHLPPVARRQALLAGVE